jgi:hypothetical protein
MIRAHPTVRFGLSGSPALSQSFGMLKPQLHFEFSLRSFLQISSQRRFFTPSPNMEGLARLKTANYTRPSDSQPANNQEKYSRLIYQDHFVPEQKEAQRRWRRHWEQDAASYERTLLEAAIPYKDQ